MGAAVEVRGRAVGDGDGDGGIHRLERPVRSLVDAAALPVRVARDGHGRELRDALPGRLRSVFVSDEAVAGTPASPARQERTLPRAPPSIHLQPSTFRAPPLTTRPPTDLLRDVQVRIVQRITTKLQAEGRVEKGADADADADAESTARAERRAHEACAPPAPELLGPRPGFLPDLARPRPAAPVGDFPPPGFEDEHEINRPPRAGAAPFPDGRSPLAIGHDDLYPPGLGPRDPLVPSRLPRPGGPAGMHPSLDDFLSPARGGGDGPDAGFDPQAPPGARWDPFGPGGGPRLPGRGGHPFGGAAGGHPFGGGGGGHII